MAIVGPEAVRPRSRGSSSLVRIIQRTEAWGGMEHNNTQLAVRLAARGFRVKITTIGVKAYSLMPERYAKDLEIEEIPWREDRPVRFRDWFRLMRERPAEIAVFPKNWWAKGGVAMMAAACLVYDRVAVREHVAAPELPSVEPKRYLGFIPVPRVWHLRHLAYGRLISTVPDRIICVSNVVRDRLVTSYNFPTARTVTVHNGIDCALFRFDPRTRATLRDGLEIRDDAVVFGAVGRIQNGSKRHDLSLRAFARLVAERPRAPLFFLLFGDGPDRDEMSALATRLGVADRFVLGSFTAAPWEAYSALDVFLMPSAFEAFGLALAEAMAAERCVVAMATGGIPEVLADPGTGFLVPADDEEAFYRSMRDALDLGPEGRRVMGSRARESVVQRFDADRQYAEIIANVIGS